jgi:GNAT superfamily N-acetyltransferase
MRRLVEENRKPGVLAYDGSKPVGWASVAPRDSYERVLSSPTLHPRDDGSDVFSLVCFYIDPTYRGQGVSTALLEGAVNYARKARASALEVYPRSSIPEWRTDERANRRLAEMDDYMGRLDHFERHGFTKERAAGKRMVMRIRFET